MNNIDYKDEYYLGQALSTYGEIVNAPYGAYIAKLCRRDLEELVLTMAERLIESEEIKFCKAEDDTHQGEFTVNDHFFWDKTGEDLLCERSSQ